MKKYEILFCKLVKARGLVYMKPMYHVLSFKKMHQLLFTMHASASEVVSRRIYIIFKDFYTLSIAHRSSLFFYFTFLFLVCLFIR
jgi:hypothetical protein